MKHKPHLTIIILLVTILVTGCKPDSTITSDSPAQNTAGEPQIDPQDEPYPAPDEVKPVEGEASVEDPGVTDDSPVEEVPYPEPNQTPPVVSQPFVISTNNEYSPAAGDSSLDRGNVFITTSDIFIMESFPMQVRLQLAGDLPTPCHELRAIITPPDNGSQINIEVYSVSDPEVMCTQVLSPFEVTIPIGDFTAGSYSLLVNGDEVGTLDFP